MNSKSNLTNFNYSPSDTDNLLFILYSEILYVYDGEKWGQIYINEINMPDTDFKSLKRPGLVEISPQIVSSDLQKLFVVTGGFNPNTKNCLKTVYLLNFKKNKQYDEVSKKENVSYDCLLDFKYGDMRTSRFLHASLNIDNKFILLISGKNEKSWLDSCEYLDLSTGKWEEYPSLKCARTNFDFCYYTDTRKNKKTIYVYGGYSGPNIFPDSLIEYCDIEISNGKLKHNEWKTLKMSVEKGLNLPKISARIIRYDDNILIIGGSDGKHILKDVFELDPSNGEISKLGELKTPRNNFHVLLRDDLIHLVGGSANKFIYNDDMIDNYVEKFTFDLSNRVDSSNVSAFKEIFLFPLINLGINQSEFIQEPGFPYSSSIITKKFD